MNLLTLDNKKLIGFNIYNFLDFYQKEIGYTINENKEGFLFLYDQFFPFQVLEIAANYNNIDIYTYINNRIDLLFLLSQDKIDKIIKIYFFYTFTFYSKHDYKFNILELLKEKIEKKFKKEVIFILNNHFKDDEYIHFNSYRYDIYNEARKNKKIKIENKKEKIFISLNAKKRPHRDDLYDFIINNNLINNFYYAYLEHENKIKLWETISLLDFSDKYFFNKHLSGDKSFEYYLNDDLFTTKHGYFFDKSYYYIITETSAMDNLCFMGEKTYKAFYHKIPFIVIGNPYSLKNLKKEGFKTFEKWIDESYDNETNYEKRKNKIFNEILRLNSLSVNEHEKNMIEMNEIIEFNYSHFMNTKTIKNDFLKVVKQ